MTLTAFARMSTPFKMLARPSLENLISLCAPRLSTGFAALAAVRRTAEVEALERRCMARATGETARRRKRTVSKRLRPEFS